MFIPRDRLFNMEDEIRNRLQKPGEPTWEYVVDIQTLMRRHGGFSEPEQVARVHRNLHTDYRKFIRREDATTIQDILERAEEIEQISKEEKARSSTRAAAIGPIKSKAPGDRPEVEKADAINEHYSRETCCWRCGQRGHQRLECRRPQKLFCSYCGTTGRSTVRCPCNKVSGNGPRAGGRGTNRPKNTTPQQTRARTTEFSRK